MEAAGSFEMLAVYYQTARLQETVIFIFTAVRTADVAETLAMYPILSCFYDFLISLGGR
jgi:hypothetical protein